MCVFGASVMVCGMCWADAAVQQGAAPAAEPSTTRSPAAAPAPAPARSVDVAAPTAEREASALMPPPWDDALHIEISPGAWFARLRGTTQLSPGNVTLDAESDLSVNSNETSFTGEAWVSWGGFYSVGVSGFSFETSGTGTSQVTGTYGSMAVNSGDTLSSSFDAWMVNVEFDYTIWRPFADQVTPWSEPSGRKPQAAGAGGSSADLRFNAIAAAGWLQTDFSTSNSTAGGSESWERGAFFLQAGGGVDLRINPGSTLPIFKCIDVGVAGGVGTSFTRDEYIVFVRAGITGYVTPNVGVEFGYRLLNFEVSPGSGSNWDGSIQGLYGGMSVRF